ncbi:MAG: preprotein translocase subunit SecE [Sporomusaceae bacterium]|nr:preprotein translocase subunit SecE [Sporomusaceae bacterium]
MAMQEAAEPQGASRFKKFLREVKSELKKVSWPDKQELISYTGIVFISVVVVALVIWAVDNVFNEVLRLILK